MQQFSFKEIDLKTSAAKWLPFWLVLIVLSQVRNYLRAPQLNASTHKLVMLPYWAMLNTLRSRQNDRHSPDDILKWFALVQIMACRLFGAKPLSEPMMVSLPHIYVSLSLNELNTTERIWCNALKITILHDTHWWLIARLWFPQWISNGVTKLSPQYKVHLRILVSPEVFQQQWCYEWHS